MTHFRKQQTESPKYVMNIDMVLFALGRAIKTRYPLHLRETSLMKTYSAFMQRVVATAGPQTNFNITVQAVTFSLANITAEAQYPGYKCPNAPTQGC
ncbi:MULTISPECIES: hypothetical protein [Pseudomonas]|uniref:Uncharacterized protein n=1 Tax=Pseudomonas rhodesiae TaxID=76760 RepID=A0A8I1E7Z6_9PSED|nr:MULTISPECIES: hypothetical protein [Pseudomonas]MBI6603959.1 hypothetical protein [Pseudomonas sp. S4_EA_1b]MBI6626761.1 hypothetical protein [Pseudomonas rhodesiae]QYM71554.1 hypothetical protein K1X80_19070 [Pseudomonas sp. So3.2b]RTY78771.1 hypothetical protein EKA83_07455 [Pseudomonas veronii]